MAESTLTVLFKGQDQSLNKTVGGIERAFGGLGNAVKTGAAIGVGALVGLGTGAVAAGSKLIGLGSDAEEMLGKFNVVFANTGGQVTDQLSAFADEVGRSTFELQGMASTFGDTLKPMGFSEEAAADFSVQLSMLATDLGSFNNMEMDEALQRLQGTLIGSHENALAFGVIINENTLAAELAANGWDKLTGAELEQAKVQARINLLMQGTTDAQGDAARTAGSWANQMRGLKSQLTDAATELGQKLIPALSPLLGMVGDLANWLIPQLANAFNWLIPVLEGIVSGVQEAVLAFQEGDGIIGALISFVWELGYAFGWNDEQLQLMRETLLTVWEKIITVKDTIVEFMQPIITWVQNNIQLKDALIALGIVLGGVVLLAILSVAQAMLPILAAGAALIGLVALVRTAWEENWGGIQQKTAVVIDVITALFGRVQTWLQETIPVAIDVLKNFWENVLLPAIQRVWAWINDTLIPFLQNVLLPWLQEKIPAAIEILKGFWENTLLPAIEAVWNWMETTLIPFIQDVLVPWLQEKIPAAIETLKSFWETVLLPALKRIWEFLTVDMMPIWEALSDLLSTTVTIGLEALAGIWENVLLPAIKSIWQFIKDNLIPTFNTLRTNVVDPLVKAFDKVGGAIAGVVGMINTLNSKLQGIQIPPVLQRQSPSPFEMTFLGAGAAIQKLNEEHFPKLQANLQNTATSTNNQTVNNTSQVFNWNVNPSTFDPVAMTRESVQFAIGGI
jgi:hypothetical protein